MKSQVILRNIAIKKAWVRYISQTSNNLTLHYIAIELLLNHEINREIKEGELIMKYYTADEAAKKLKVSTGHIYELVKKGEIKKKEGMGRTVRIPASELKTRNIESAASRWSKFNEDKVTLIHTSYGKVRKIIDKKAYLASDIAKALNKCDSYVIKKNISNSEIIHMKIDEAKEYGLLSTKMGLALITIQGIKEYLEKAILHSEFNREIFIEELLEIDKQISIDEVVEESSKNIKIVKSLECNDVQIFSSSEFGEIKTILFNKQPWFIGKEVAENLGYVDSKSAIRDHVDSEDKTLILRGQITTLEIPNRGITIINESGLYSLILKSKLPSAKKFKRWVTNEVLPTIRKTGGYVDNSEKFVDNYFSNLSKNTKKIILSELENKNKVLMAERVKIDKELLDNVNVIEKIQETL